MDSILANIVTFIKPHLKEGWVLYADLPKRRASEAPQITISTSILCTPLRPDLVLVGSDSTISLLELTVCSNTVEGFTNARTIKHTKQAYVKLISDLKSRDFSLTYNIMIEIGSLGHHTADTFKALTIFVRNSTDIAVKMYTASKRTCKDKHFLFL